MKRATLIRLLSSACATACLAWSAAAAEMQVEYLDRGLSAVNQGDGKVYLSWRLLGTDPPGTAFNVYREAVKLNQAPISATTDYLDTGVDTSTANVFTVREVIGGAEQPADAIFTLPAQAPIRQYSSIHLDRPADGQTPDGVSYFYTAHDCSVGDLDGDGDYEVILKWEPTHRGSSVYRGPYLLDAYRLDGERLWRINLGINTLADAFIVYDLDGDGRAELASKTGDGTVSGTGQVIGDPNADWVGPAPGTGHIIRGPEYLSIFEGRTGAVLVTTDYIPTREPIDGWGGIGGNGRNDSIGNRANKFLAAVAYLDGSRPSLIMCRGYFGRSVLVAWDWRDLQLTRRWTFDSGISYPPYTDASPYSGMGNHNLSVADVDLDGRHEIIYGAMVVDDNGTGLCTSGGRHGDALHAGDLDPSRPGVEVFGPHENEDETAAFGSPGASMYDARTGEILFGVARGVDVGRGVAEDIDPRQAGCENWGGPGGLRNCRGETISEKPPASTNFVIWWDGDLTREMLDANHIDKWDWEKSETTRLLTASECSSNNGTKAVPCLTADLFGDWREEVIWRTSDSSELRIYTTTIPATNRFPTLMHDHQYRVSVAWQNVGYNQPPHTSFFLGAGMKQPPQPNIRVVGGPKTREGSQSRERNRRSDPTRRR